MEKWKKNQYESSMDAVHSSLTGSGHSSSSHSSSSSTGFSSGSSRSSSSSTFTSSSSGLRGQGNLSAEERRRLEQAEAGGESDSHLDKSGGGRSRVSSSWSSTSSSNNRQTGSSSSGGRTEHSGSRGSSSLSAESDRRFGVGSTRDKGTSGSVDIGREVIIDTRGSNIGDGWTSGSIDVTGSRVPIDDRRISWYNETRTFTRYPSESGETRDGSGSRTNIRYEKDRDERPGKDTSHFEERHYEKNMTWDSNERRPHVSTSWRVNKDGVTEEGRHRGQGESSESSIEKNDESYFGRRNQNFNDTWMISENNRNRGVGGGYESHRQDSRVVNRPSGTRNYSEERTSVRNTTWSSQGGPAVTSEHSSWSVNQDGTTKNGSQSRVYHDKDDYGKEKFDSYDSSREVIDRNALRGGSTGSRTYSEEHEIHRNTTWSSADGKPITEERRNWRVDKDGVTSSGSSSRSYEGSLGTGRDHSYDRESHRSGQSSGVRTSFSSSREEQGGRLNSQEDFSRGHSRSSHGASGSSERRRGHSEDRINSEGASGWASQSSRDEHERRRTSEESGSWGRTATNTNIGDLFNQKENSGYGAFGEAVIGPRDGVAKTYTLDLGVLDSASGQSSGSERRGGHRVENSNARSKTYSSESGERFSSGHSEGNRDGTHLTGSSRHYEFGSTDDSGRGSGSVRTRTHYSSNRGGGFSASHNEDDGVATRGSSSYERTYSSGSSSSSGGGSRSWGYSMTSGTADGDSTLHGGSYSRKQERSSSHGSSHYGPRNRRQVSNFLIFIFFLWTHEI